jgi:hypothetical protein
MSIWLAHSATRWPKGRPQELGAERLVDQQEEMVSVEPCDGCGSIDLLTVLSNRTFVEYRCSRCRYRLIRQASF